MPVTKSISNSNDRNLSHDPIPARFQVRPNGSYALSVTRGRHAILVETSPGFARVLQRDERGWHEKTLSPGARAAAHIFTSIEATSKNVKKYVSTRFADGTRRFDQLRFAE
jgi:hypothetical protein